MAHEKLAERLGDYFARLGAGKAHKIKPHDLEKLISKLQARRAALLSEMEAKPDKAARLEKKIAVADELLERAAWLRSEINANTAPKDIDMQD